VGIPGFVLVFKLNFWREARGHGSLKKQQILHYTRVCVT